MAEPKPRQIAHNATRRTQSRKINGVFQQPAREKLAAEREVSGDSRAETITIRYTHPDPEVAALVANHYADQLVDYFVKLRIEWSMAAVEDLRRRAEHQGEKVAAIQAKLINADAAVASTLRDELEVNLALHQAMLERVRTETSRIDGPTNEVIVRLLDAATPPTNPSGPNHAVHLLLGAGPLALVGLLAGAGRVFRRR